MQIPPQIVLRDVPDADKLHGRVTDLVARLEKFAPRIIGCRVVVERPHQHHRDGNPYHVRIDVTIPGHEIVVGREPPAKREHEDVNVALRDAFDAVRRRLEDAVRERRGDVKAHVEAARGEVVRIAPDQQFGFLRAKDGHEVYFHRQSVQDGKLEDLPVGTTVSFEEETGEKGVQATWVRRLAGPTPVAE